MYTYLVVFSLFKSLKFGKSAAYVNKCLLDQFRLLVAYIANLSSRYLHYFAVAMLVYGTPTWWLHAGLCKFVQNISTNIIFEV